MRITIDIDDDGRPVAVSDDADAATSEGSTTDAGAAPRSPQTGSDGSSDDRRATSEGADEPTDAGSAPDPLPDPAADPGERPASPGSPTDGGGAPELNRSASGSAGTDGGHRVSPAARSGDERADAGPPPASVRERAAGREETAIDYETVLSGPVEEVKERVEAEALDAETVLDVERAGANRTALVEWLRGRASVSGGTGREQPTTDADHGR